MIGHALYPAPPAPGLNDSVPGASLPVIFLFLEMNPRRQDDGEIESNGHGVWFIQRSQMGQLLVEFGALSQVQSAFRQALPQTLQFLRWQPIDRVRIVACVYHLG